MTGTHHSDSTPINPFHTTRGPFFKTCDETKSYPLDIIPVLLTKLSLLSGPFVHYHSNNSSSLLNIPENGLLWIASLPTPKRREKGVNSQYF